MTKVTVIQTNGINGYMHDASRPWLVLVTDGGHSYAHGRYQTETVAKRYARKVERKLNA